MRILVTGANGYLGSGIVKAILNQGNDVIAVDFNVDHVDNRAIKMPCDLFKIENPYHYFGKPDILLHLAWRDGFVHYSDAHINDLPAHYNFIKTMAQTGCKHIAAMGSMHEIGFFEGSINENTPCHPTTPYGIGKNSLRDLTEMICKKNDCVFQCYEDIILLEILNMGHQFFLKLLQLLKKERRNFHLR